MGHTITHFTAVFCSLIVVVLLIPVTLSCSEKASGLKNVYFLKIGNGKDYLNVGVSGYCTKDGCKTPVIPFYLDVGNELGNETMVHIGGKAVWVFYIMAIASWGFCFVAGLLAHRVAHYIVNITCVLGTLCLIAGSGVATGVYVDFRNSIRKDGKAADMGDVALGLTWATVIIALVGAHNWLSLVARGHQQYKV